MRRAGAAVLLVLAMSAVVAIAADGTGLLAAPLSLDDVWTRRVRVAGVVVALVGIAVLLLRGRRLRADGAPDSDSTGAALGAAAVIMGVVALIALLARGPEVASGRGLQGTASEGADSRGGGASGTGLFPGLRGAGGRGDGSGQRGAGGDGLQSSRPGSAGAAAGAEGAPGSNLLRTLGTALVLILLVLAGAIGLRGLLGRTGDAWEEPQQQPPVAAPAAEAGFQASLEDVSFEGGDPRRQIKVAYRRLLFALAAAGAPREPHEAPHEYLVRALGPLGLRPAPMHRLTELYVMAQFSEHPITERHRKQAVAALEAGLLDLRSRNGAPEVVAMAPAMEARA